MDLVSTSLLFSPLYPLNVCLHSECENLVWFPHPKNISFRYKWFTVCLLKIFVLDTSFGGLSLELVDGYRIQWQFKTYENVICWKLSIWIYTAPLWEVTVSFSVFKYHFKSLYGICEIQRDAEFSSFPQFWNSTQQEIKILFCTEIGALQNLWFLLCPLHSLNLVWDDYALIQSKRSTAWSGPIKTT